MEVNIGGMIVIVVLVALLLGTFYVLRVKWLSSAMVAVVRGCVQMGLVAVCLWWLFRMDNSWLNALAVLLMAGICSAYVVNKAYLRQRLMFIPVLIAMLVSVALLSICLLGLVLRADHWMAARWILPVSAYLLTVNIWVNERALREYFSSLYRFSSTYYYCIGNGASWLVAVAPFLRRTLERTFLRPIRHIAVMGALGLPVLLSGLLIAGWSPLQACGVTVAFVVGGLVSALLTLVLAVVLSHKLVIDRRGNLTKTIRTKQ